MTSNEEYSDSTQQKHRHSGVDGTELPVVDYDNTTLQEATDTHFTKDGQLVIPQNLSEGFSTKPLNQKEIEALEKYRKKQAKKDKLPAARRRNLKIILGAAAASVIMGGGTTVYVSAQAGSDTISTEPNSEPSVSAPANPGDINPSTNLADIVVQNEADLANYLLETDLNSQQVFDIQDNTVNEVLEKLSEDDSYVYTEELSHIAQGQALESLSTLIETVHGYHQEREEELINNGVSQDQIDQLTVTVQTIRNADQVITVAGYEQSGVMSYWMHDGEGNSARLIENDYPINYGYSEQVVGVEGGDDSADTKHVFLATSVQGEY